MVGSIDWSLGSSFTWTIINLRLPHSLDLWQLHTCGVVLLLATILDRSIADKFISTAADPWSTSVYLGIRG